MNPFHAAHHEIVKFPDSYPIEYARVRETSTNYYIVLQGRKHPDRLTLPGRETVRVRKSQMTFASPTHAAKWASHSRAAKRIRTRWEGLCLVTEWRSRTDIDPEITRRVAAGLRETYGSGSIYTSEDAQARVRQLLNQTAKA